MGDFVEKTAMCADIAIHSILPTGRYKRDKSLKKTSVFLRLLSFRIPQILLVVEAIGFVGLHACTVKAVGADGFLGQTDTVDEGLYLAEL